MTASRSFPETLVRFVTDLQSRINIPPSEDRMVLPRASLLKPTDPAPEAYKSAYEELLSTAPGKHPYTVIIPPCNGYQEIVNGRLICCLGDRIHIWEDAADGLRKLAWPVDQVDFVEAGRVLLFSWIRVSGQTTSGDQASAEVRYNTITDYVIDPVVGWLRGIPPAGDAPTPFRADFDVLRPVNHKLANYSRRSIPPDANLIQWLYQPQIRVERFRILGFPIFTARSRPHLAILTEKELALIQDGALSRFSKAAHYGGTWRYVPRSHIRAMTIEDMPDGLLSLVIDLPGESLRALFTPDHKPDLDALIRRVKERA